MTVSLAETFLRFAVQTCGTSPLYEALARGIPSDGDLLALAVCCRKGPPPPNLLFAAVHALLLGGADDSGLPRHYRSLTDAPQPPREAFPAFRAFCLAHRDAIRPLLERRSVGTNEVARCAVIRAGLAFVSARHPDLPLHTIEIGASAGLLLLWDRVRCDYGAGLAAGPEASPLVIACESRGRPPPLALEAAGGRRVGVDLDPMDASDPGDRTWLQALVWPEHAERRVRLDAALAMAREAGIAVRRGDGIALLPELLSGLPPDGIVCVLHAFTFNQVPEEVAHLFTATLAADSQARPLYRLAFEWEEGDAPELTLTCFRHGTAEPPARLARAEPHGRWIEWLALG